MNNIQQILRILSPAIRGFPLIIIIMAIMIFIASRVVRYSTPMYESTGRIKLEDPNTDISKTNLFKDFDVFNSPSKIMAEVEVLKSPEMLKATLDHLDFNVCVYRQGKIRTSELYLDSPFKVQYNMLSEDCYGKQFVIHIHDTTKYTLDYTDEGITHSVKGYFGQEHILPKVILKIKLNHIMLEDKPGIKLNDDYYFKIYSNDQLIQMLSKNIDVKELDKEIPIIRIICKHPVPEKAMRLTNYLMHTYIDEGIKFKIGAAHKATDFIEKQLNEVGEKLKNSEEELERYRLGNKITNTKIEVETDLKKVAQLKIQLINVEMNLATLDTLDEYTNNSPEDFLTKAPNYEGYGGLLYTELMKKLKDLQGEKKEMLTRYTPENDKIKVIDSKIDDVVLYIKKNIHNAKNAMRIQRDQIVEDIRLAEIPFETVPTKEKKLLILERDFQLNQQIYKFLSEKKTEASIAQAATFSFHRIIQKGELPTVPVSPKKTFTMIVFGFLGLLSSLALLYIYDGISSRVKYKDELEKNSSCPVIADIRHGDNPTQTHSDFLALATKLSIHKFDSILITITSGIDEEGKTYISKNLAKAFVDMQVSTLLVGSNLRSKDIGKNFSLNTKKGFSEYLCDGTALSECVHHSGYQGLDVMPEGNTSWIPEAVFNTPNVQEALTSLKKQYKVVIIDTPSFDTSLDALKPMMYSDVTLYVFRAEFTKTKMMIEPDIIKQEYNIENIKLILNDVAGFAKFKKGRGIRRSLVLVKNKIWKTLKKTRFFQKWNR